MVKLCNLITTYHYKFNQLSCKILDKVVIYTHLNYQHFIYLVWNKFLFKKD